MDSRFIVVNPRDLSIVVACSEAAGCINIPASESDITIKDPVAKVIYWDIINPAKEEEDRRLKRKNIHHFLAPPDPWLVALGYVMWEGIFQGMAWDTVKLLLQKAATILADEGVALRKAQREANKQTTTQLGFVWTEYLDGEKQREIFLGLKRAYRMQQKQAPRKKK